MPDDEQPAPPPEDDQEVEKPALLAHPYRLPLLLLVAFALTVALAAAVLGHVAAKDHASQQSAAH